MVAVFWEKRIQGDEQYMNQEGKHIKIKYIIL